MLYTIRWAAAFPFFCFYERVTVFSDIRMLDVYIAGARIASAPESPVS